MPGDPNERRNRASTCIRLAERVTRPDARTHFLGLATQWERLASELESTQVFLDVITAIDLTDTSASIPPRPASVPEIAAITGHSYRTITSILERYLPRNKDLAEMAIAKLENSGRNGFCKPSANRRFGSEERRG